LGLAIQTCELLIILLLLARKVVRAAAKTTNVVRACLAPPRGISPLVINGIKNIEPTLAFSMPFGTSILALG
jgi:hypothetical protein